MSLSLVAGTASAASAFVPVVVSGADTTQTALLGKLGARPGATRIPVAVSDRVSGSVDVATGNGAVSLQLLSLPGVQGNVGISLVRNTLGAGDTGAGTVDGWRFNIAGAGHLYQSGSNLIYTSGDGYSTTFVPVTGQPGVYTTPAGVKADLVASGSGWKMTSRTAATVTTFDADGNPVSLADRNGNTVTVTWANGLPTKVVAAQTGFSPTGTVAASRTAWIDTTAASITVSQGPSSSSPYRTAKLTKDPYGNWSQFTDPNGKLTTLSYANGDITGVTVPDAGKVSWGLDTSGRVTSYTQANASAGSPGYSVTRLAYPTSNQTLIAGPNTDQSLAVSAVPRTTYTIDASARVTKAVDAMGRTKSQTYTPDSDVASSTSGTGTTAGTTTNTFGANSGQSLTASQGPGGASGQAEYGNTAVNTKYLATSSTDDAGNASTYTFNGAGNQLTSSDALAAEATLTYNTDGTVATATAPGNGTNQTVYNYNTDHQLTSITPVTGAGLGTKSMTYDNLGRAKTATNGNGVTLTYGYDNNDRLTSTAFSDGTPTVTNTYNGRGQITSRVDSSGTTTYGYDQAGRLTSRANTAGGGTISYGYDKAGNLTSKTDTRGTTTYAFDDSNKPTELRFVIDGGTAKTTFATDDRGRRTDTWLASYSNNAAWAAHTHVDYDTSSRVARVIAEKGPAADKSTLTDVSYCHSASSVPSTTVGVSPCPTTQTADRSKIQWEKNNLTGQTTRYVYDKAGRLTKALQSGGTNPVTYAYTYDARGNRLTGKVTGGASQSLTFNAANQITTTGYEFDGQGNMTKDAGGAFTYNGADQMTKVTKGGVVYNYDYAGASSHEVLKQGAPGGVTYEYVYGRTDAQGLPVIEQLKRTGSSTQTAYIEHDPVTGQPIMLRTDSGMQSLYVPDGTGNPSALITGGAQTAFVYQYDPYGTAVLTDTSNGQGVPQNPYLFKMGLQDRTTGWVKYGARWYNPATGRWTQMDTMDAPLDPANANRYAFAANDPINNSDPTGLCAYNDWQCQAQSTAPQPGGSWNNYGMDHGPRSERFKCMQFQTVIFGLAGGGPSAAGTAGTGGGLESTAKSGLAAGAAGLIIGAFASPGLCPE